MNRIDHSRWLISHTRGLLSPLILASVASIANKALGVVVLVIGIQGLISIASGQETSVTHLLVWLIGLGLLKAGLRYLEHYAGHWVAFTSLQRLRELFFDRLVPQAPAATQGRAGAELSQRATRDIDRIEVFFAHTLPPMTAAVLVPVGVLAWFGATVNGPIALVIAVTTAAALLIPVLAARGSWAEARGIVQRRGAIARHLGDDIQGIREVVSFDAQQRRLTSLAEEDEKLINARRKAGRGLGLRTGLNTLIRGIGVIAVIVIGQGQPPAAVALGLAIAVALWGPSRGIDDFIAGLDAAFASTARVRAIVDAPPLVTNAEHPLHLRTAPGDVTLEEVRFTYPGAVAPSLDGATLSFPAERWSYLVGASGSGKSTTAGLLLRGWDPQEGRVCIGDVPVTAVSLDELRSDVALASQRPTILSGDIAANLRLARPEATEEELWEALEIVDLADWVRTVGLDHRLSARGVDVSGGQLQRLALARALVGQPEILILDEALSQLDADTMATVRRQLRSSRPTLTVIEITHRVDLIPSEALVHVVDAGEVVQTGTAHELHSTEGPFTKLLARL